MFKDTQVKEYNIRLNDVYGLQLGDAEHIKSSKSSEDICLKIDGYEFILSSKCLNHRRFSNRITSQTNSYFS